MRLLFVLVFLKNLVSLAQVPFVPLDTNYRGMDLILPKGFSYQILFSEGDNIEGMNQKSTKAKGAHDYNCFISESATKAKLFVSHECNDTSNLLGDGGGATVLDLVRLKNNWIVSHKKYVDFASVGGTIGNCSGTPTSEGRVLTAEEFPPQSNAELYRRGKGFRDTSDINALRRWQNMGWMVEVDVQNAKATKKLYAMGRYSHEAALIMPDNKTVYLTDDFAPSVFFKFVATEPNQFDKGQLYAYKQLDEQLASWIELPMSLDSLLIARDVALRLGATFFLRMEWMASDGKYIYISETGSDNFLPSPQNCYNSKPALHLLPFKSTANGLTQIDYPYGGVLRFDPENNAIKMLISGGAGIKDSKKHFANPDGLIFVAKDTSKYLLINEDILSSKRDRVSKAAEKNDILINEIWWLDLSINHATVDHLQRFLIAPKGTETTGGYFDPTGKTYFLNIQHPSKKNKRWNRSSTIAIRGWTFYL